MKFIAMNRFKIVLGYENDFESIWKNRETHLDGVPGFEEFNLIRVGQMNHIHYMHHILSGNQRKTLKHGQNQRHFV